MPVQLPDSPDKETRRAPRRRALALRWHLVLLVAGALLPLAAFAALVVYRLAGSERAAADRRLMRSAQDLSAALDRETQATVRALRALAESSELGGPGLEQFHAEAARVRSTQPAWLAIILLTPDGRQVVNTSVPWGTPLHDAAEPESLRRVVEQRRPAVGHVAPGRLRRTLGFTVRVPVERGGELRYVLTAVISPEALAGVVGLRDPSHEEWTRTIIDSQGVIVARTRDPERFVGRAATPSLLRLVRESGEGLARETSMDGEPVYVAYRRDPFSGWTAAVAVPAPALDSPTRDSTLAVLGLGLGLLSLSTLGAFALSRRVARGLEAAAAAAETMSRGGRPAAVTSRVREVAHLGRALAHSSELLARRERERDDHLARADAARAEAEDARRAQEALLRELRGSEARLRLVTDHAPVLIVFCDAQRRYKFVNQPYADRFGLRPEELVGRGLREVLGEEAYAAIEPHVEAALRGERVELETLVPYRGFGARQIWAAYRPELDAEGRVTGFVGAILDVTERRRAEAALRESESRFAKAFEASPLALTITSLRTGRLLEVNETFTRLSGFTREEAVGSTTLELGLWAEPAEREAELEALARDGRVRDVECRLHVKGGGELAGMLSAERIEVGGEPCALTVIEDITEKKRAEAERDRMLEREKSLRAEAEEASRLKDEFLATVSHELRTPLTAILGWSHMLENGSLEGETARHAVAVIRRNAEQQRQIVDDVLDVSRVVAGKLSVELERVELALVVQTALDTVRPAADAKSIRLRAALDPRAEVTGDPARLRQVVWNLLTNAVKFTPPGGEVGVSAARLLTHARVEVCDTGQGIAPDFLPYVFDRFRQADGSTTRRHGGLGLGLSLVRHLVEAHGGSVHAYSAGEGQGATFTVDLPLPVEAEQGAPRDADAPPVDAGEVEAGEVEAGGARDSFAAEEGAGAGEEALPPLAGLRLLLVDDDEDTLEMLGLFLRRAGAEVTAVASAVAALGALERVRPDVVVADIGMPGVDGYELIRRARALGAERGGATPAVALTAYAGEADRVRALRSGFQAHLPKPVEPGALISTLVNLAGRPAASEP